MRKHDFLGEENFQFVAIYSFVLLCDGCSFLSISRLISVLCFLSSCCFFLVSDTVEFLESSFLIEENSKLSCYVMNDGCSTVKVGLEHYRTTGHHAFLLRVTGNVRAFKTNDEALAGYVGSLE